MNVPALLRQYGLRPDPGRGQNFLVDESALQKIVDIAAISSADEVLEIGPGAGSLTRLLAAQARRVVAVELDERLIPILEQVLSPYSNVHLVQGDILAYAPAQWMSAANYQVVANIPYYITSALIRHLLEADCQPARLVLTVQREVAERICAVPGKLSLLALSVQLYGLPQVRARIPAGAFYPPPKVDSAVVRVDLYPQPLIPASLHNAFFRLAKAGFSQKRKTLGNSLAGGLAWSKEQARETLLAAGIDPRRRAETLSLPEWEVLTRATMSANSPAGAHPLP
jgi:16S rRNA (adenine1518-N6/adenine1519-N6)-dimethyltransferase